MASSLARLAKQSGIYTLGNLTLKAGGLILLLLYLDPAYLTQAEYGRLILLETVAQLFIVCVGLGLAQGLLKYATDPVYADERGSLAFTALVATTALAVAAWGLVVLAARPLAALLLDDGMRVGLIQLMGVYIAMKVVAAVPYMALRIEERVGWYVLGVVVEFAVFLGGVYYFLAVRQLGLEGVVLGLVVSATSVSVLLSVGLLTRSPWRFKRDRAVLLLRFGAPLIFASLASVLLNTGDRFVLKAFEGADAVAVYGLAQKFGGLVNMLFVQSFSMAFAVLGLKALGSLAPDRGGEVGRLHRRTFRHFAVLTGWGVLGISVLTLDVTAVISSNPAYLDAAPLVLPIGLGFMAYGIYYIMMNVLYATERTGKIASNVLGAAGVNLLLNLALIPLLGAMGAALATLVGYAGLAAVTARQAHHVVPIAFPWRALGTVALVIIGLWSLAQPSLHWAASLRLGWRMLLLMLYPVLVLSAGVYTRAELVEVRGAVQSWWARRGAEHDEDIQSRAE